MINNKFIGTGVALITPFNSDSFGPSCLLAHPNLAIFLPQPFLSENIFALYTP